MTMTVARNCSRLEGHLPRLVEVVPVLTGHPSAAGRDERLAQGHGDEVLEQLGHVQQEAVDGHRSGSVLGGGSAQD